MLSPWKSFPLALLLPLSLPLSAINVHFYCHLRNSAHYHNNNSERAAGCGHRGRLTTNHRPSTMANDMSLLSFTGYTFARVREFESRRLNRAASDYESIRIEIRIGDKESAGPSSRRAHPIVGPSLGNWATVNPATARGERREERGPCQVLEAVSCVLLG